MVNITQQEVGALDYEWCLSSGQVRCRIAEAYEDAEAVFTHFMGPAVQEFVPKLLEHATITRFEVYGDPGEKATELLKTIGAEIFTPWHGFTR
jgi:quinol monooxygenase YgiN